MLSGPSKSGTLRHPSPLAAVPSDISFPFPGFVEKMIKEEMPEILFMKREIRVQALPQQVELDPDGGSIRHFSIVPHRTELLVVEAMFYSPGRNAAELATPDQGGLLSRIAEAAPVPSTVEQCQLVRKHPVREWKLRDDTSMWCYFPVHMQISRQGHYRTESPKPQGWMPHGKLILKFDVEHDPKNQARYKLLKGFDFFPESSENWQTKLLFPS